MCPNDTWHNLKNNIQIQDALTENRLMHAIQYLLKFVIDVRWFKMTFLFSDDFV